MKQTNLLPTALCAAVMVGSFSLPCRAEAQTEKGANQSNANGKSASKAVPLEGIIYEVLDSNDPGNPIKDQSFDSALLKSITNDNSRHLLFLRRATPFLLTRDSNWARLSIGGEVLWSHQESSPSRKYGINFSVNKQTFDKVVEKFHPKIEDRHHPGHQVLAVFSPEQKEFEAGGSVTIKLKITNVGKSAFTFQVGCHNGGRDNQFSFTAARLGRKLMQDIGDRNSMGGISGDVTLKPQ